MTTFGTNFAAQQIRRSVITKQTMLDNEDFLRAVIDVCELLLETYRNGCKVLIAGNGGSAADAQHIAAELVSRFVHNRPALPALALTTDTSILTAISNDFGYEQLFSRQLEASARPGDLFIAISTSGNSKNILAALKAAEQLNVRRVGLTGANGEKMRNLCNLCLCVPSAETAHVQEAHITLGHIFCRAVEEGLFIDGARKAR